MDTHVSSQKRKCCEGRFVTYRLTTVMKLVKFAASCAFGVIAPCMISSGIWQQSNISRSSMKVIDDQSQTCDTFFVHTHTVMSNHDKEILPTPVCVDKLGRIISPGSLVVYGSLLGRCAALRVGRVLKIRAIKRAWSRKDDDIDWRILVQGIDDKWSYHPAKLCEKKGTLMFPDRMIVVDASALPAEYRRLLEV